MRLEGKGVGQGVRRAGHHAGLAGCKCTRREDRQGQGQEGPPSQGGGAPAPAG